MFSFRSNARRFQVVSFVLAVVCFAVLSCQTTAMGHNASEKKTAVVTDAGSSSGDQKKGIVTKTAADKNKPANSNGQSETTKTPAKGTQNNIQKNNGVKSSQEIRPFWEKAWDDIKSFFSDQKKTPVPSNDENRPGAQKKTTVKKVEKKTNPEKIKPAISNGQTTTTKIAAKGTQNNTQKVKSVKSSPNNVPLSGKTQENVKPTAIIQKKTPVRTNAVNSANVQKKGTVKTVEKKTNPEKNKPAVSSGQAKTTKTAAKGTQSNTQKVNSLENLQGFSSIWQKAMTFYEKYESYLYLVFAFFSIAIYVAWSKWLEPRRRRQEFEKYYKNLNEFKKFALKCIELGFSNNDTDASDKIDFDSLKNPEQVVQQRLNKIPGQEPEKKSRTWAEYFRGVFHRKNTTSFQISEDDAYLMIVTIIYSENDYNKDADKHRKVICEIYDKRYKAYWKKWFENITLWSVIILLFPFVLNKLPTVIYHILKIFNYL